MVGLCMSRDLMGPSGLLCKLYSLMIGCMVSLSFALDETKQGVVWICDETMTHCRYAVHSIHP
jgi:hypothetical protein